MRSLRQQLEQTQARRDEIDRAMRTLVDRFKQAFRPPRPAQLVLHNTGNGQYVRWRLAGSRLTGQAYFELLHGHTGISLLQSLSPTARQVYLEFEQQRLRLNLLYGLHQYAARSLQRYLDAVHQLAALKRGA